ncbi:MAG: hypothetical protein ACLSAB_01775 [Oscillospiraceae bacterium]
MDRDILLACRDASLGYEHRALLEHLTFTVRAGITSAWWARTAAANRR